VTPPPLIFCQFHQHANAQLLHTQMLWHSTFISPTMQNYNLRSTLCKSTGTKAAYRTYMKLTPGRSASCRRRTRASGRPMIKPEDKQCLLMLNLCYCLHHDNLRTHISVKDIVCKTGNNAKILVIKKWALVYFSGPEVDFAKFS
jgi:hypothetical protein